MSEKNDDLEKEIKFLRDTIKQYKDENISLRSKSMNSESLAETYGKRLDLLTNELNSIKIKNLIRKNSDDYFMDIATVVASRATCDRKHVGAVIVRDRSILATGYNGSLRASAHCDQAGHLMEDGHCVRTVHAEANAIIQAAKNGMMIDQSMIYVTASPCFNCFKLICNSGINKIVFKEFYRDQKIFDFAQELNIELVHLKSE